MKLDWNKLYKKYESEIINLFGRVDAGYIDFDEPKSAFEIIDEYDWLVYGDIKDGREEPGESMSVKEYELGQRFVKLVKNNKDAFHKFFMIYKKKYPNSYYYHTYNDYSFSRDGKQFVIKYSWIPADNILVKKKDFKGTIDTKDLRCGKKDLDIIKECVMESKKRFDSEHVHTTPVKFTVIKKVDEKEASLGGDADAETGLVRINTEGELFNSIKPASPSFKQHLREILTHEFTHIKQFADGYVGNTSRGFSDIEVMAELEKLLRGGVIDIHEAKVKGHHIGGYYTYILDEFGMTIDSEEAATEAINDWMNMTGHKNVKNYKTLATEEIDKIIRLKKGKTFLWKNYIGGNFDSPDFRIREKEKREREENRKKLLKSLKSNKNQAKKLV